MRLKNNSWVCHRCQQLSAARRDSWSARTTTLHSKSCSCSNSDQGMPAAYQIYQWKVPMYHAMELSCGSLNHLGSAKFCSFSMQTSVYVSPASQQRSTANLTSLQPLAHLPPAYFLEVSIVVLTSQLEIFIRHDAHNYMSHGMLDGAVISIISH